MRTQILTLSLFSSLSVASFSAFAESPVQAGETLESLSKVKVSTTVNGQPGSLNELLAGGQIKLVNDQNNTLSDPAQAHTPAIDASQANTPADTLAQPQISEPAAVQPKSNTEQPQTGESTN